MLQLQDRPLHIVDVGCGYGDMLRRIHAWAKKRGLPVILTGIDLNPNAIAAARNATAAETVTFVDGNAYDFQPREGIDVVISSLLTHHLENHEIIEFLRWVESVARVGWFVNDLHRQALPYHFFRIASRFTNWHRFVKHDGGVSILRSFRRNDWETLTRSAKIPNGEFLIEKFRPARLCVARVPRQRVLSEEETYSGRVSEIEVPS